MKNTTTESLRDLLIARDGYHTFTATLGTNGNGGALAEISSILEADQLDDYQLVDFDASELEDHIRDATGNTHHELEDMTPKNEWVAFDCAHEDGQGYLTGSVSRIYVNLSA